MKFSLKNKHAKFMKKALELAKKADFFDVFPNPFVGCVIVKKGKIIAQGFHKKFGGNHAEINALMANRRSSLKNSIMYINLEPCFHYGKTPPCVNAIIESGIKSIVIAMKDKNPLVNGKSMEKLKKAGIKVKTGVLKKEAEKLNKFFLNLITRKKPFVAAKIAMSLDGKIATKTFDSKWITSRSSRNFVHTLRDKFDAVLVGKNTVLYDNPSLKGAKKEPIRIVLDSKFSSSLSSKVFRNSKFILVTTAITDNKKNEKLAAKGGEIKIFRKKISLAPLLQWLAKQNINSILLEGGSEVFGSFFDEKLIDKFYFFIAPKIIGGRHSKSAVGGKGINFVREALKINSWKIKKIGPDILIECTT